MHRHPPSAGARAVPCLALALLAWGAPAGAARAQALPDPQGLPDPGPSGQQSPIPGPGDSTRPFGTGPSPFQPGFATGLFRASRPNLLGSLYGLRTILDGYGIALGLQETDEVFGNATGGLRRGADYNGLTTMSVGVDTAKAFGLEGGILNVSAFQIHGRYFSADNLASLQTASGIEAQRSTRLWEAWYQQGFLAGNLDVKAGQQSLDQEFIGSSYSGLFINTAMGWPLVPSVDLYAGGPAYPLSSLGVRARFVPARNVTVLAGVFDDNPAGGSFYDDFQVRGAAQSGTEFSTGTGAFVIGEVQYAINQPAVGDMDRGGGGGGLPGTYKLGFWYDTATFPDQRTGTDGLSLANRASNGVALGHRGNYSVYGVVDQMVWRPDPASPRSAGVFARIMGAPGDRNVANFSLAAGVTLKAPLPGRDNDTVGLGYGLARISASASGYDADNAALNGAVPVRSSESFLELTYQYQAAPWLLLQPDLQYVYTPGGGIANPLAPGRRVGNEAVFGIRTNITF
ncbi:MAG: carbohydrate porin [Janthinobacterium lividum]